MNGGGGQRPSRPTVSVPGAGGLQRTRELSIGLTLFRLSLLWLLLSGVCFHPSVSRMCGGLLIAKLCLSKALINGF